MEGRDLSIVGLIRTESEVAFVQSFAYLVRCYHGWVFDDIDVVAVVFVVAAAVVDGAVVAVVVDDAVAAYAVGDAEFVAAGHVFGWRIKKLQSAVPHAEWVAAIAVDCLVDLFDSERNDLHWHCL
mmetsp:Transcript_7194/g.13682  ORF Transcript_7194/g.13682 Transcript_7194/m.13682 type:complete len:125 (+) Transcript_7194:1449-1823(+)